MARLLSGQVESEELARVVVPHLAAVCPQCREVWQELDRQRREMGHWDYAVAASEGGEAAELWRRLAPLPYPEQLQAVNADPALHTWGLCRLLQHASERAARDQPERAAQLAGLAVRISGQLGDAYHPGWVRDLKGLSLAYLGNARRALGERLSAGAAFDAARSLRAQGSCNAAFEAEALALEALLRRDQHRLGEAVELLEIAQRIYRGGDPAAADPEAAEPHLAGRALAHQAWCHYHLGKPETALALLAEAEQLVDRIREPRLALAVLHGRIWSAVRLGRFEEAGLLMPLALELAREHGDDADRLRLRRSEARLDRAQGEKETAARTLHQALEELMDHRLGVDAALAALDLGDLYLEGPATEALHKLGTEIFPLFSLGAVGHDMPKAAVYALLLFQQACWEDRLTAQLVESLAGIIEMHRRPCLSWWSRWGTLLPGGGHPDLGTAS